MDSPTESKTNWPVVVKPGIELMVIILWILEILNLFRTKPSLKLLFSFWNMQWVTKRFFLLFEFHCQTYLIQIIWIRGLSSCLSLCSHRSSLYHPLIHFWDVHVEVSLRYSPWSPTILHNSAITLCPKPAKAALRLPEKTKHPSTAPPPKRTSSTNEELGFRSVRPFRSQTVFTLMSHSWVIIDCTKASLHCLAWRSIYIY